MEDGASHTEKPWLWGPYASVGLFAAILTFVADQSNKWWMLSVYEIETRGRVSILPFFDLVFVKNTGVSYGLGSRDDMLGQYAWASFALIACIVMWVLVVRAHSRLVALSLGLIIGGALGNAVDRLHLGGVADFYLLHGFGFEWYVFNLADTAIVAGVAGLLYDLLVVSRDVAAKSA